MWRPSTEEILRILGEQNPWHRDGSLPPGLAPPAERFLVEPLYKRLWTDLPHRFQVILGHRRVGKTTVMYQLVERLLTSGIPAHRLWWFRLDHPRLMEVPLDMLVRATLTRSDATSQQPLLLFLDEVVYARDWDLWLKAFYDEGWPVKIVATASATAALRDRRAESGVGRWEEQHLTPYLLPEYLALDGRAVELPIGGSLAQSIDSLPRTIETAELADRQRELMLVGGFPELLAGLPEEAQRDERSVMLTSQATLRSDAVERAIYKDIPQSFDIENPLMLERVLYLLAGQMTGVLSPTNVSRDLGVSQPTLDRYVAHLQRAFLLFQLSNYSGGETRRQRRGRKVYFVDGAVRNAALQRGAAPLDDEAELGQLRENMAGSHLYALSQQSSVRLFHWRKGDKEADFVYDDADDPLAFEISSTQSHSRSGLQAFVDQHPRFRGGCYLVAPGAPVIPAASGSNGIGSLPYTVFLAVVGLQAEHELRQRLIGGGSS